MLRSFNIIILALVLAVSVFAGKGKITGIVTDVETGDSLLHVNIQVIDPAISKTVTGAATNFDGEYFILNVPTGIYDLKASYIGYESQIKDSVEVLADSTIIMDFALQTHYYPNIDIDIHIDAEWPESDLNVEETAPPFGARSSSIWSGGELVSEQKNFSRVRAARQNRAENIDSLFAGFDYPAKSFLRAFKLEQQLELWAYSDSAPGYVRIKTYPFTAYCGDLGPKRKQGDMQIPEGFYRITDFNPASSFHLSMGINYPNRSDRIIGDQANPGGDIRIHGSDVTIGCIPIGDNAIEELYIILLDSRDAGHEVPVHIFPCRFADSVYVDILNEYSSQDSTLKAFWENLRMGFEFFEDSGEPPKISIDSKGRYVFP